MLRGNAIILLAVLCIAAGNGFAQSCSFSGGTETDAVAYLRDADSKQTINAECILRALRQLTASTSPDAIQVVIEYLDYSTPPEMERNLHDARFGRSTVASRYVATNTLASIGDPALPYLIDAIASGRQSEVADKNALETILSIYKGNQPQGVRYLLTEAAHRSDPAQKAALQKAAKVAAQLCSHSYREGCEAALSGC